MTHDDVYDDDTQVTPVGRPGEDAPPALPFALRRRVRDDETWLASLPDAARAVLEAARDASHVAPAAARPPGSVARPLPRIPSLRAPR